MSPRGGTGGVPSPPGRLKYDFVRLGLRILMSCYVRVRVVGGDRLPDSGYLVCFNHPSWLDPLVLAGFWPDRRPLFIFGPRERDMSVGRRNRLIVWSGRGVPFKPGGVDLLDTSRRAVGVLAAGGVLAVAGEGRLSDREGEALPLQEGVAYFAIRAGVPIVPAGIVGTRWVHFGKRLTLRIGHPVPTAGLRGRDAASRVTAVVQASLAELLGGPRDERVPGPFGRWVSDLFNERPWLDEAETATDGRTPER